MTAQIAQSRGSQPHPLEVLYTFRNPTDVAAFLVAKPPLVGFLEEAATKIHDYFPHSPLQLQHIADLDEFALDHIVIWIVARDDDDSIRNRLFDEWWVTASQRLGTNWTAISFEILAPEGALL